MDKVYLTSDQYVVKQLEESKEEITKLNAKYDDLLAKYVKQQAEIKKLEELKARFTLKRNTTDTGYGIYLDSASIVFQWDSSSEIDDDFQKWLDLLGLELPKGEK